MGNLKTVQEIYAAFGRGDVADILSRLSPQVEWEYLATNTRVPWLQHRNGPDAVAGLFQSLGDLQFEKFAPKEFLEAENLAVLLDVEFTVKKTGQRVIEVDEAHIWRFDATGQVVRFKHVVDTYNHHVASGTGDAVP